MGEENVNDLLALIPHRFRDRIVSGPQPKESGLIPPYSDTGSIVTHANKTSSDSIDTKSDEVELPPLNTLRDIIMEVGRPPYGFFGARQRHFLCKGDPQKTLLTDADLEALARPLQGCFGFDNRAGIDGTLHRISAMRSAKNKEQIYSLTYRVG